MIDFPNSPVSGQTFVSNNIVYVFNGVAWVVTNAPGPPSLDDYVLKAGDTMTGRLTLSADPVNPLDAATKQWVESLISGLPLGGTAGQALVKDPTNDPQWGANIDGGDY
jgi:hypothetical protein